MFWTLLLAGTCSIALYVYRDIKFRRIALKATKADCDTGIRLVEWRLANPDVAIAESPIGRRLVLERLAAWKQFLVYHLFIKDDGFSEFLLGLLNDMGPLDPAPKRAPRLGLFFYIKQIRTSSTQRSKISQ